MASDLSYSPSAPNPKIKGLHYEFVPTNFFLTSRVLKKNVSVSYSIPLLNMHSVVWVVVVPKLTSGYDNKILQYY